MRLRDWLRFLVDLDFRRPIHRSDDETQPEQTCWCEFFETDAGTMVRTCIPCTLANQVRVNSADVAIPNYIKAWTVHPRPPTDRGDKP